MARVYVAEPYAAYVEERLEVGGAPVGCPGFVRRLLLRPAAVDEPYVVVTFWERAADFEAWNRSETVVEGGARLQMLPRDAFRARTTLETFETFDAPDGSAPFGAAVAGGA